MQNAFLPVKPGAEAAGPEWCCAGFAQVPGRGGQADCGIPSPPTWQGENEDADNPFQRIGQ